MHADAGCELDPKDNQLEEQGKDLEMLGVASACPLGDLPLWLSFKGWVRVSRVKVLPTDDS